MNKIVLIIIWAAFSELLQAQTEPPVNDICSGAIELSVADSGICTPQLVTIDSDVEDSNFVNPGCGDYQGADLWYKVSIPNTGGVRIETSMSDGSISDTGMAVYKGSDCNGLILLSCNDDIGGSSNRYSGISIADTPGNILYIRVWEYGGSIDNGTFNICAYQISPPPVASNDDCSTAISLSLGVTCSSILGSNNATSSEDIDTTIPGAGCASYQGNDVWFKVTVPSSGNIVIETRESDGSITDGGLAVYTGDCDPNGLTLLKCDDDGNKGLNTTLNFERIQQTNLAPGLVLYIRVWSYENKELGTFNICAIDPGSLDDDNDGDGYSENQGDCNDANANFYPGATEICDGLDNDCDGEIDEGLILVNYFPDLDEDGYGDANASPTMVCSALKPEGFVNNNLDCNDDNENINPDTGEIPDNGIDENCDGFDLKTWYQDSDND
ncbi:putative metal-binding motif-containing protein, partial [Aestuariibaculum sediminum]